MFFYLRKDTDLFIETIWQLRNFPLNFLSAKKRILILTPVKMRILFFAVFHSTYNACEFGNRKFNCKLLFALALFFSLFGSQDLLVAEVDGREGVGFCKKGAKISIGINTD